MIENYATKFLIIFEIMQISYFENIYERGELNNKNVCYL